jgi:hypothetical protein
MRRLFPIVIVAPALLLLGACGTTITASADPSAAPASAWADYRRLPVELHGAVPGHTQAQLAASFAAYHAPQYASLDGVASVGASRRVVLFVNPSATPQDGSLCDGGALFQPGTQTGRSATVTGALCDGTRVISTASGYILTRDQTAAGVATNLNIIRDQLYQSLFPGANDPGRYYQ